MSESNYPSIDSDLVSPGPSNYTDASTTKRFINYLIDIVAIILLINIISILFILVNGVTSFAANALGNRLIAMVVSFFYYFILEGLTGRTLGKIFTKTKVIDEDGNSPGWAAIAKRSGSRLIPFDAFSFFGGNGGWHDKWSDTRVVNK